MKDYPEEKIGVSKEKFRELAKWTKEGVDEQAARIDGLAEQAEEDSKWYTGRYTALYQQVQAQARLIIALFIILVLAIGAGIYGFYYLY